MAAGRRSWPSPWPSSSAVLGAPATVVGAGATDHQSARTRPRPPRRPRAPRAHRATVLAASATPPPTTTPWAPGRTVVRRRRRVRPVPDHGRRPLPPAHQRRHRAGDPERARRHQHRLRATGPPRSTPCPCCPPGPRPASPGRPTSTASADHYVLYFTAMVAGHDPQTECIGSAVATSPTGPVHRRPRRPSSASSTRAATSTPGSSSTATAPRGCRGSRTRTSAGRHPHQDVVGAALRRTAPACVGSPSLLLVPRPALAGHHRRGPRPGRGRTVPTGSSTRATGTTSPPTPSGRPGAPARPDRAADASPPRCWPPTSRARGPGEASVFHDDAGALAALQPVAVAGPAPGHPAAAGLHHPARRSAPSGPYLAAGPPPSAGRPARPARSGPRRPERPRPASPGSAAPGRCRLSPAVDAARRPRPCRWPGPWSPS